MRATKYTAELAAEIIKRISNGETLAEICRGDHMPAVRTISDWKAANSVFDKDMREARIIGFDAIAERTRLTARGKTTVDGGDSSGDVQRDKLIIETDIKLLAKWFPQRYGDKVQLEHSGEIGAKADNEIDARIAELLAKFGADEKPKRKPR